MKFTARMGAPPRAVVLPVGARKRFALLCRDLPHRPWPMAHGALCLRCGLALTERVALPPRDDLRWRGAKAPWHR